MARKKQPKRRATRVPLSDEKLIVRLKRDAAEVLAASVPEAAFEAVVEALAKEVPGKETQHFYCRKCGEYHLKEHPHRSTQRDSSQ